MISESSFFDGSGFCVSILQCQVSFLAGTDFDNIFNIVNEYFSITDLTGMKHSLSCFDYLLYRNQTDNNFNLDLRKKIHIHFNTTIVSRSTFLYTTAQNICDGNAGYTDFVHCLHELIKLILTGDDHNLCKLVNAAGAEGLGMDVNSLEVPIGAGIEPTASRIANPS